MVPDVSCITLEEGNAIGSRFTANNECTTARKFIAMPPKVRMFIVDATEYFWLL